MVNIRKKYLNCPMFGTRCLLSLIWPIFITSFENIVLLEILISFVIQAL